MPTDQNRTAAFEVCAVILAIVLAWLVTRWGLYPLLGVADNAPLILRPVSGFFVAWYLLHRRGLGWWSMGLNRNIAWWQLIVAVALLYLAIMAASRWLVPPLSELLDMPTPSRPGFILYIRGNLLATLGWLGVGWVVGGFMEECLFRGFLLNRVAEIFGGRTLGLAVGVVTQACLFGLLHYYSGAYAVVSAGTFAIVSGACYLLIGRRLWPLVLAHGIWNSVAIWNVYRS